MKAAMVTVARKIGVVDYGAGNLTSVSKAFAAIGCEVATCSEAARLDGFAGIVVPGVGHFAATTAISAGMRETILRRIDAGVPLLGICLGMQWLFEGSSEAADAEGLGILPGRCTRMQVDLPLKVPHVGWNVLKQERTSSLMDGIARSAQVYFTHSFAVSVSDAAVATAVHGRPFVAAVQRKHVCGVQFHPEKSGDVGLHVLRNFVLMARN
jgi:imidazole glycerol-phosphate synthase subunit HisH